MTEPTPSFFSRIGLAFKLFFLALFNAQFAGSAQALLAGPRTEPEPPAPDEPAKPDQPLPWLTRMFPTPEREKPLALRNPLDYLRR